ncbi:hypothetical protein BKH46_01655 [Helicobacter sp. 12S02634-8]|uniref:conjugal transfer protein TraF n=1 Tax=Helicobacter sp. 12S02634-8 TaxID=1476199 RepID=UPI000BA7BB0A|nr:conjugal transfer protein TraF [Helicobacter sp. 12S02634-8]PAF48042.1 hypothetical protein BKH46_01655 [Helicobacter sp. 12S02634-8]
MKRISQAVLIGSLLSSGLEALEFGGMGNISASMGGAGVALRNSQWALYYNPALLGMDKKSRVAYSFGASIREKNLLSLASVDYNNLQNMPHKISTSFTDKGSFSGLSITGASIVGTSIVGTSITGASMVGAVAASSLDMSGVFGDVLKNIHFGSVSGLNTTTDIQNYMKEVLVASGGTLEQVNAVESASSLEEASKAFKGALITGDSLNAQGQKAFENIKTSTLEAVDKTGGDVGIFKNIIQNLEPSQLSGIADLLVKTSDSSFGLGDFLKLIGGVSLSKGDDPQINRFIQDVYTIQNTMQTNNLDINTQNGLVFQIGGNGPDGRGAIAFGVFGSAFASASATFDRTHNQIIFDADGNYVGVSISDNSITLSGSDKDSYENLSIFSDSAKHQIHGTGIVIGEVPVGYGQAFSTPIGNFSIGLGAKYIFAMGYKVDKSGSFNEISNAFGGMDLQNTPKQQTFGIDFGFLYNYQGFSLGIVGKDINEPILKVNDNQKITLNSQIRAGLSYEWKVLSFALDADLKPNHTLSYLSPQNQMIGGGVMVDLKYFDIRLGSMYDLKSLVGEGVIFTGGINILGFLDIAVQSNTKLVAMGDYKVPSYLSVKLGGGFSW